MARFDLTDFEWSVMQPLLPNKPRGVPMPLQHFGVDVCPYVHKVNRYDHRKAVYKDYMGIRKKSANAPLPGGPTTRRMR